MSALALLGYTWLQMGNPPTALAHLQEGLTMARESRSPRNIFNLQCNLAKAYLVLDDLDSVRNALTEVLTLAQSLGGRSQIVEAVSVAVAYYQRLGQNEQAAVWAGTILGDIELDKAFVTPVFAKLEAALGLERYQAALKTGQALVIEDILAEFLSLLNLS